MGKGKKGNKFGWKRGKEKKFKVGRDLKENEGGSLFPLVKKPGRHSS